MCVFVCVFVKLHATERSGPVIYSLYAIVLHVTHLGVTSRLCVYVCGVYADRAYLP